MGNSSKVNNLVGKCIPINIKEQQKLEDHYLNKITLLQEQLKIAEQELIQLLRTNRMLQIEEI